MRHQAILLLSGIFSLAHAQTQQPDGVIVPFTSKLPACASLCGVLFDVQGACEPPVLASVSSTCFCADSRLSPFMQSGTAGVTSACKASAAVAGSCTATSDLEKIQSWYATFCNLKDPNAAVTTTAGSPASTGTGSSSTTPKAPVNQTWFQGHWKYIVMLIVMILAIVGIWVGAIFIKRRYIRKKEREIEMKPPVAWGPHQMQGATGGYNYGDGIVNKETSGGAAPVSTKRESKGWLTKKMRT